MYLPPSILYLRSGTAGNWWWTWYKILSFTWWCQPSQARRESLGVECEERGVRGKWKAWWRKWWGCHTCMPLRRHLQIPGGLRRYICVLVFCVSVVTVFFFVDKFVPQITAWNTCKLPIPSFLTHVTKIRLRHFKNLCLSIYMRTSYLPTDTLYPFSNLPTILPLSLY